MTPNPPESPTSSQELIAVRREIAEIEEAPDYMGPKIYPEIELAERVLCRSSKLRYYAGAQSWEIDTPPTWVEAVIVGVIGRACDARGWRYSSFGPWWGEEEDTYRSHISDEEYRIIATAGGESRAITAVRAYLAAIGGDNDG